MLAQGMKGNQETKIKKAISPEGGGGYSEIISLEIISSDGDDWRSFWVWNFLFSNFFQ